LPQFSRGAEYNIAEINDPSFNQALAETSGIDLQLNYSMPLSARWDFLGDGSSFSASVIAFRVFENGGKVDPAASFVDCVGIVTHQFSNLYDTFMTPVTRANIILQYKNLRLSTALSRSWISGLARIN